jgi:hypothetical protein
MIGVDRATLSPRECAIGAQHDLMQVIVVADARKHDLGALRCYARRISRLPPYCFTLASALARVRL